MKKCLCLSLLVAFCASNASAVSCNWNGSGTDRLWTNLGNWVNYTKPGTVDQANIQNEAVPQPLITDGMDLSVDQVQIGYARANNDLPCILDMTGGALKFGQGSVANPSFWMGNSTDQHAQVNMSGSASIYGDTDSVFKLGYGGSGTLNMYDSSTLTVGKLWIAYNSASASGCLNLYAGTVNVTVTSGTAFSISRLGGTGLIKIDNGVIKIYDADGSRATIASGYVTDGKIVPMGNKTDIRVAWDQANSLTTIYAVPEPITLAIMGIGGLLAINRRR